MTKKLQRIFSLLILTTCLISKSVHAQNVTVSGATAGDGTYATLADAFTAINAGVQTGATITVAITGNTTETATATLNANTWKSLTISPSGGAARSISGNLPNALINLSGVSNVLMDGLNTGGNSLTIDNTNTGNTSTLFFNNDCNGITIQNSTLLGAGSGLDFATILFGGATNTGNSNITIKGCSIDASSAGFPVNGIYSGKPVAAGKENTNDSILNSWISNYFNATLASSGILLDTGNTKWGISGCRFFQSASRTYTVGNTHAAIKILGGSSHTISGNFIGFSSSTGTGVYTMGGTVATRFIGIDLTVGSIIPSSVQGNTITALSLNTAHSGTTGYGSLCGIKAIGRVNIGDLASNIIGGATGVDLITVIPTVTQGSVVGINSASTDTMNIKNNVIGGLTASSSTPAIAGGVVGIGISARSKNMTITGNTIGNTSPNNMRAGLLGTTTGSSITVGILFSTAPNESVVTNNTLQNLSSWGTGTAGYVRGIVTYSASGVTSPFLVKENTVTKLTSNSTLAGVVSGMSAASGIIISAGVGTLITENTISDISLTGTTTATCYSIAIGTGNGGNTTISKNKIYNITNASTSTTLTSPGAAVGILLRSGLDSLNVFNNMISLGSGSTNNTVFIGIMANHGFTPNPVDHIYHNTVNISGTVTSGALPSFCFLRGDLTSTERTIAVNLKNNIFNNTRSGGTGAHFAIANNFGIATSSPIGWISDNNILNSNAATIGYWSANQTFTGWKTASGNDAYSFSGAALTFMDPITDLHLNMGVTPTVVESNGQTIAAVTTDFDAHVRPGPAGSINGGAKAPDIGADEIDGVFADVLAPFITYTAIASNCDTTTRTLKASISDVSSVPYPSPLQPKIYYRKNNGTWLSATGTLSGGTASSGTWDFPISTGSLAGVKPGDTVSYFVIAQDVPGNIISNPSAGLVATDVNTITTFPTNPNYYVITAVPAIVATTPGAVCDSGKVTLTATASAGTISWYTVSSGGVSQGTGTSFLTPQIKTTTSFYAEASFSGCSSPRTEVIATVNHSGTGTITQTTCDSIVWNGKTYKTSGIYKDTIKTTKGCDSIVILTLTIPHSSSSTQSIIACDAYTWQGTTYTASGTYKDTIPNKAGCDSLMLLNLTIHKSSTYTQAVKACGPYVWNGDTYTSSGTYKDTIKNASGCDSIMILNLTIIKVNATVTISNNVITADSVVDSYQWVDCLNNYAAIAGETNKSYTATSTGSYAVIETKEGCIDTSACVPIIITGISAISNDEPAKFYPNPGTGLYNLFLAEAAEIKIMNLAGEVIFDKQLQKGEHLLDILKSANGVYMMHLSNQHQYKVYKLIKQD